jgi:hypothetical protein
MCANPHCRGRRLGDDGDVVDRKVQPKLPPVSWSEIAPTLAKSAAPFAPRR